VPDLEVEGWAALQPKLNALSKEGKFAEMRAPISDDLVAGLGVVIIYLVGALHAIPGPA
jgi:hypothetical protein